MCFCSTKQEAEEVSREKEIFFPSEMPMLGKLGPQRVAFFFLDDQEQDIGATTASCMDALLQNAGPLIISGSLLQNIFKYRDISDPVFKEQSKEIEKILQSSISRDKESVGAALNKLTRTFDQPSNRTLEEFYFQNFKKIFNPGEWIFKQINEYLFLLVPLDLFKKQNIVQSKEKRNNFSQGSLDKDGRQASS